MQIKKYKNQKSMKKLLLTLAVLIFISCSTFKLSTHNYDPIYGPSGNEIEVDIINTQWDLNRKLQNDFQFRYNFAKYAINQPYSWYFQHRTFNSFRWNRINPYYTYDTYFNRDNFWMDWAFGYPFNSGWNNFGWNNRGFNSWNSWNNNYYGYNMWGYNTGVNSFNWQNRNNRRVSYSTGRRGSNTNNRNIIKSTITKNNNITIRTNIPRNTRTSTVGNTLNIDNPPRVIRNNTRNPNPPRVIRNNTRNPNPPRAIRNNRSNSNPPRAIRNNNTRPVITSTPKINQKRNNQ